MLAQDLCFFSLRSPGDCVGIAPATDLVSRFLLVRQLAFAYARLLVSEILQHLAAMRHFRLCGHVVTVHLSIA